MDLAQRINTELAASAAASAAGHDEAANQHWRKYVELLEQQTAERRAAQTPSTPAPNREQERAA